MKKTNRKLSIFEIVWYSLTGGLGVWGLVFVSLGIAVRNLRSDAPLAKANAGYASVFGLGYLGWGLILFSLGVVLAVIVLLINAKKSDREVEKQQRRAARIAAASVASESQSEETKPE